jgi:hypothetical protein
LASSKTDQSSPSTSGTSFFSWLPSFTRAAKAVESEEDSPSLKRQASTSSAEKKAALDFLDEEIKSLNEGSSGTAQNKTK